MALTLENICQIATIKSLLGISGTDEDTAITHMRNQAIGIAARILNKHVGLMTDTANPFISASYIEDVIVTMPMFDLRLSHNPVTAVSDILDADGNSFGYEHITDFYIRDIDDSDSDAIRRFTGKLWYRSGTWPIGEYRVSYTAGFSSTNFPYNITSAIAIIAQGIYNNPVGLQSEKEGGISYTYIKGIGFIPTVAIGLLQEYKAL